MPSVPTTSSEAPQLLVLASWLEVVGHIVVWYVALCLIWIILNLYDPPE